MSSECVITSSRLHQHRSQRLRISFDGVQDSNLVLNWRKQALASTLNAGLCPNGNAAMCKTWCLIASTSACTHRVPTDARTFTFNTNMHPKPHAMLQGHAVLRVSALHYSTGSWNSEGVQTVASAHVLHQPTIACPSISIISVHKFGS